MKKTTARRPCPALLLVSALLLVFPLSGATGQEDDNTLLLSAVREEHFISPAMAEALLRVPRSLFFPDSMAVFAREDRPLPDLEAGMVPAPSAILLLLQRLGVGPGTRLLILGRGGGYAAGIAAAAGARVTLVEESRAAERYRGVLSGLSLPVTVLEGSWSDDALRGRLDADPGSFDALFVHAGIDQVPEEIGGLIAPGGRAAFPLNGTGGLQTCVIYSKTGTGFTVDTLQGVSFGTFERPWSLF